MSSASALQSAILTVLAADTALVALLGSARRIFDAPPPGTPMPYVLYGPATTRDWSTGTEAGAEHTVTLSVRAHASARTAAHDIADRIRALLHDQALVLAGHRLVNVRAQTLDVRREKDGHITAALRLRAVTEPL
jgi:hypothetical protein